MSKLCVKSSTIDLLLSYHDPFDELNLHKYGKLQFRIKFKSTTKEIRSILNLHEELLQASNTACQSTKNSLIYILYKEFIKVLEGNVNKEAFYRIIEFNSREVDRCYYYFGDERTNEFIKLAFNISPKE
jgi:hypothetical protein